MIRFGICADRRARTHAPPNYLVAITGTRQQDQPGDLPAEDFKLATADAEPDGSRGVCRPMGNPSGHIQMPHGWH